jgi:hypothetical protein
MFRGYWTKEWPMKYEQSYSIPADKNAQAQQQMPKTNDMLAKR